MGITETKWPAEWAHHFACIVIYPHNASVFRSSTPSIASKCDLARAEVRNVARAIGRCGEHVLLFCDSEEEANTLKKVLRLEHVRSDVDPEAVGQISVHVCESDDSWARDTGPTFVFSDTSLIGLDWKFNAYGGPDDGCYWPCNKDQKVSSTMCHVVRNETSQTVRHRPVDIILEGGSIHTDGEGTVLATEECLLNPNRNPSLTKPEIEEKVLSALGCQKLIWLPRGLAADEDTNGHIDNMTCFTAPGEIVLSWCDDEEADKDNYDRCREAMAVLELATDAKGRSIQVHKLMVPPPMWYTEEEVGGMELVSGVPPRDVGERLAASYVNFYIANTGIIVPQFGHEATDAQALDVLGRLFPGRTVEGVNSKEILLGGGNIHCITQQVPLDLPP
eukprot:scaffold13199_cov62-Attheya_sp.AAC.6